MADTDTGGKSWGEQVKAFTETYRRIFSLQHPTEGETEPDFLAIFTLMGNLLLAQSVGIDPTDPAALATLAGAEYDQQREYTYKALQKRLWGDGPEQKTTRYYTKVLHAIDEDTPPIIDPANPPQLAHMTAALYFSLYDDTDFFTEVPAMTPLPFEKIDKIRHLQGYAELHADTLAAAISTQQAGAEPFKSIPAGPFSYYTNTKVANCLATLLHDIEAGEIEQKRVEVTRGSSGQVDKLEISAPYMAFSGTFSEFDRSVQDTIGTIFEEAKAAGAQDHVFVVPSTLYARMIGAKSARDIKSQQARAVVESIEKMRSIRVTVQSQNFFGNDYMIAALATIESINGRPVFGYKMHTEPIVYAYSKAERQVYGLPRELLQIHQLDPKTGKLVDKVAQMTPHRIATRDYIFRRVQWYRYPGITTSNKVLFADMYKKLYFKENGGLSKAEAKRQRDFCIMVLENLKGKKLLTSYRLVKKGRRFIGFSFSVPGKEEQRAPQTKELPPAARGNT